MANIARQDPFGSNTPTPPEGAAPETIIVHERTVACDGGKGPLGHPRVYMRIVKQQIFCTWCSRIYRLPDDFHDDGAH
jgi:uncharacterized Zn-finger protein